MFIVLFCLTFFVSQKFTTFLNFATDEVIQNIDTGKWEIIDEVIQNHQIFVF